MDKKRTSDVVVGLMEQSEWKNIGGLWRTIKVTRRLASVNMYVSDRLVWTSTDKSDRFVAILAWEKEVGFFFFNALITSSVFHMFQRY